MSQTRAISAAVTAFAGCLVCTALGWFGAQHSGRERHAQEFVHDGAGKGKIVEQVRSWPGPRYFLRVRTESGSEFDVPVPRDTWLWSRKGELWDDTERDAP